MTERTSYRRKLTDLAEMLPCAGQKDFAEGLTGERRRVKGVEYQLPRMVADGILDEARWGRKKVYRLGGTRRKFRREEIEHGLTCTRCLLKLMHGFQGKIVSERFFRRAKFGAIPDWAILDEALICFELSRADNFRRTREMKRKLAQYRSSKTGMESFFDRILITLFIFEVPRFKVRRFVDRHCREHDTFFYFTDLASFLGVENGKQLSAPIYIWSGDGNAYPLTE